VTTSLTEGAIQKMMNGDFLDPTLKVVSIVKLVGANNKTPDTERIK
jgi:hypothetical protein